MTQADLLEQMYSLLHEIHMVARHEELVVTKRENESEGAALVDPDKFPI